MMCFFLDLKEVLAEGSSSSFSCFSSSSIGELSVVDWTPCSLSWSDWLSASISASACGSVVVSSSGSSVLVTSH